MCEESAETLVDRDDELGVLRKPRRPLDTLSAPIRRGERLTPYQLVGRVRRSAQRARSTLATPASTMRESRARISGERTTRDTNNDRSFESTRL